MRARHVASLIVTSTELWLWHELDGTTLKALVVFAVQTYFQNFKFQIFADVCNEKML